MYEILKEIIVKEKMQGDLDFTLWDHPGHYAPFGYIEGNLAIPARLICDLIKQCYAQLGTNIVHAKLLLLMVPDCCTGESC